MDNKDTALLIGVVGGLAIFMVWWDGQTKMAALQAENARLRSELQTTQVKLESFREGVILNGR